MGRQAGEARLPGRGAGHHEEQINCHAAIPRTSPRGTTPITGRMNGYEDAPTGMLQVAHEFEFTRYRFDYILLKTNFERSSKKQIPAILSTNYKDLTTAGNPPPPVNGRNTRKPLSAWRETGRSCSPSTTSRRGTGRAFGRRTPSSRSSPPFACERRRPGTA